MWLLLACSPEPASNPLPAESTPVEEASDSAWPSGEDWSAALTLVVEGELVPDGATLRAATAPAGLDQELSRAAVLSNRSSAALALPASSWLAGEGWAMSGEVPTLLEPGESTFFTLSFNPVVATEAGDWTAVLSLPELPEGVTLVAEVPAPLRTVVVGDGGWWATSDDGGRSWTSGPAPSSADALARTVTWGEGRFFRADMDGSSWSSLGTYAYSEDGQTWVQTTAAEDFWATDCAWGAELFVCLRGGVLSWSESGAALVHEPTDYSDLNNSVVFTGEHFVAVGRGGRRLWSVDGKQWEGSNSFVDGDGYNDLAIGDGVLVAVGGWGADRLLLSTSVDGGLSWTDQTWGESQWANFMSVAWAEGTFLAQATTNQDPLLWRSTDGFSWEPVPGLDRWESYYLLGSSYGAFFGLGSDGGLYRSEDTEQWELVLSPPAGVSIRSMSSERWP